MLNLFVLELLYLIFFRLIFTILGFIFKILLERSQYKYLFVFKFFFLLLIMLCKYKTFLLLLFTVTVATLKAFKFKGTKMLLLPHLLR